MTIYSQIAPSRVIAGNITLNESKIIHFIPDFSTNFKTYADQFPFRLSNLQALVVKSNMIRVGSISLNPKQYFIDIKQLISKTINVIPDTINNNKFIIIDHSPVMEAIYRINSISERRALFLLFNYIKNEFQYSKSKFPNIEHIVLISFNNTGLFESLYDNINVFKKKDDLFRFFDNYVLINAKELITPFVYYKQTNIVIDIAALNKLKKVIQSIEPITEPLLSVEDIPKIETTLIQPLKINNIDSTPIPEDKISTNRLTKVLSNLEIKDDNIQQNIKIAVTNQLSKNRDTTEDELNVIVLKTINKTIYGTDKIQQKYLDNPKLLTNKLNIFTEYYDDLSNFKTQDNFINPTTDLISITKITGPVRHKFECAPSIIE